MKKIVLLLFIAVTLWGEDLALVSISGHASIGSVSSLKKELDKTEKNYTFDIKNNTLKCSFTNSAESVEIHFLSTRGQLISKHAFENGNASIDLSTFAHSLYLVKGYQEGEVIFAKAIQVQ